MKPYIIAEAACTWLHKGIKGAMESIEAAAEAGASAWKTQWTSDSVAMHKRRLIPGDHYKRLSWPREWIPLMTEACHKNVMDYMCTVFLPKDVEAIAPYIDKFKVSAYESQDSELIDKMMHVSSKPIIQSLNTESPHDRIVLRDRLLCISMYPTPLERLLLGRIKSHGLQGLSDHTTSVLTGAVAVGAGATILEKHFKIEGTPVDDPDFGHSLYPDDLGDYIAYANEAGRMM